METKLKSAHKILRNLIVMGVLVCTNCESFVDIGPPRKELSPAVVFTEDATATSAVLGLYTYAWDFGFDVTFRTGLSSDELKYLSTSVDEAQLNENELLPNNFYTTRCWADFYQVILHANTILENLENSAGLNAELKLQLEGETRFMRAFCYFHLVNLFGRVPVLTTSDYRVNAVEPQGSIESVYALIIDDLIHARDLLRADYVTLERVRVNKAAASAFLARVYLYNKMWTLAEDESTKVIDNIALYSLSTDLNSITVTNNEEAILQFFSTATGINTYEGLNFIPYDGSTTVSNTTLSEAMIASFEPGDQRLTNWIGTVTDNGQTFFYPFKCKVLVDNTKFEYATILRLAEQYLIRSEARTRRGNVSGALEDLNVIRNRAGLGNTTANDESSLLLAIEQERNVELFTEGHRWYDLKRTDRANAVLNGKPGWEPSDLLYPIPERELLNNPTLVQNQGY